MKRFEVGLLSTLVLFLFSPASAWALSGTLDEWNISPWEPYDIAILDDSSVWLTYRGNNVIHFDPVTATATTYGSPHADSDFWTLDRAPDNTLWIADGAAEARIMQFDPSSLGFVGTGYVLPDSLFGPSAKPTGITVAPDGSVWFTNEVDRSIGRLDPAIPGGDFQRFPDVGESLPDIPNDIAFATDGTAWFTVGHGVAPSVNRITGTGDIESWTIPDLTSPFGINLLGDEVWFLDHQANLLVQFDPSSEDFDIFAVPMPELQDAHYFVVDENEIFWMTAFVGNNIGTFDPTTEMFDFLALRPNAWPMGIALSPTGEIWFAEDWSAENAGVGRLIPTAAEPVPEPSTILLFVSGLAGLVGFRRRLRMK